MRALPLTLVLLLAPTVPSADTHDADLARAAVERGEILPLSAILPDLEARWGGQVLDVEIDEEAGLRVYELEILTADGRLLEVEVNAVTGELIDVEAEAEDDVDDATEGGSD
ncbi:peptidase [Rubellimicrobium rubrum]|uniref:Peptidase n=2 Tax=Rubellimicrobium rubrum TaxID=2585369 RepID=A0A5C4MVS9_9RHOB|nr:peptidase [Rubellimicrobium rubrum]